MKIAYLILAHRNPHFLKKFVSYLQEDIYIHIDSKKNLEEFYIEKSNVTFIHERESIIWGGFSMVQATLNLIRLAYKKEYDFFILISGDDFLIRKEQEFIDFLAKHREMSFIEYEDFDTNISHLKTRYTRYHLFEKKTIAKKIIERIINNVFKPRVMYRRMEAYKGSQWWCLNQEAITYVINFIDNNPDVIKFFKKTHIPDEMFFQTILMNSSYKNKIVNDNLRYIELNGHHPNILTIKDKSKLEKLENKYFARKFDENKDALIIKYIEENILN